MTGLKLTVTKFLSAALLVLASSCMPEAPAPRQDLASAGATPTAGASGGGSAAEVLASFNGEARNFLELNGTRTFDVLSLPLESADAVLVWGENVQEKLQALPATSKVCLLAEFKNTNPSRILVISALRRRTVLNTQSTAQGLVTTVAYSWIAFPGDQRRNETDCLTSGLNTAKNQIFGSTATLHFSLQSLCTNCATSPQSEGLRVHFDSGSVVPDVRLSALKLRVQISTPTSGSGQGCSSNSACAQIGFNCCLEGQCVRDGAIRSGVDSTSNAFVSAWEDVQNNPTRFTIYPQFFYVCPTTIPTVPGDSDATDPQFASLKRLNEMKDLFDCLNPQFDEIGYCTKTVPNASQLIRSTDPANQTFTLPLDDNNFTWANTLLNANTIFSFRYGEQLLYQEGLFGFDDTDVDDSHQISGGGNGRIDQAQDVIVKKVLPSNALDDTLILKYKVDATCVKLSSALARCSKTYVQGRQSTPPRPSDHGLSSFFQLPHYADLASVLPIVKVGDTLVAQSDSTWRVQGSGIFFSTPITTNQTVVITYYATPATANLDTLTSGRAQAQARVNQLCGCGVVGATNCNLAPVSQISGTTTQITDYSCVYPPPPVPEPPLQQVVYVSAKSVPSRYYDVNGTVWDNDSGATAPAQEGSEFTYTNSDPLRPNNVTTYVGFHEIYGSFNKQGSAAKPPRMVSVKKDRIYDIFVDSGGFASCDNCGNDPYSPVLKLFPQTFAARGGGYVPDLQMSSRQRNTGTYRADDLHFGRACFVPATMLPWSHAEDSSVSTQRRRRLAAQHFLFANGYQRDWYGFDYGSLIGSFDGVSWFSIGNQRRIKASGSRLFLAVNGFFGDRTVDNNFKVVVSEAISAVNSGSNINHDTLSDGAECQRNHFCSNDNDCIAQLGYDYSCQNVTGITTNWPVFDASGNEVSDSQVRPLASIVGGVNGQARRCVYRGRGSPCETNLTSLLSSYNGTELPGLAACSPNNYCARLDGQSRFNTSIARFASSPSAQNLLGTLGARDTFGLGARFIGRPLDYYGSKAASSVNTPAWGLDSLLTLRDHFITNANVKAICVPGRDVNGSLTYNDVHSRVPPTSDPDAADRILGVGAAGKVSSSSTLNTKLLAMCPATLSGTFVHLNAGSSLTDPVLLAQTVRQNYSTSLLDMAEYSALGLFNTVNNSPALSVGYQKNACLRAPGASCFTDLECAPSEFVATKMRTLSNWGGFANNIAEQAFWREDLVCGNPQPKKLLDNTTNPDFDLKQNRCCRDIDKTLQVYTQFDGDARFLNCNGTSTAIAGVDLPVNSAQRNLRNNVVFDVATCNPPEAGKTPALIAPTQRTVSDAPMAVQRILNQFETFDKMNERMCCTANWVRSFAAENGGGHRWGPGRTQNIDRTIFAAWSWYADQKFTATLDEAQNMACSADNFGTLACEIRSLTDTQSKAYLDWVSQFELLGIPQALVTVPTSANGLAKLVDESNQSNLEGANEPLNKTIKPSVVPDVQGDAGERYISAASYDKMDVTAGRLKKVFSESEVNCCMPAGANIPQNANANMCCTGTLTNEGGTARCCLDDFSDVTLYLNRYVSSEGRGLPTSAYDARTGYIKDPGQVFAIAQAKNLCCSGNIVTGNVIHDLFIPLQDGNRLPQGKSRRFAYRTDSIDNNTETGSIGDIYDAGLRWNTHYYCAPADYQPPGQQQQPSN